jgi:predicted tellurium resistance membrane protein TerC
MSADNTLAIAAAAHSDATLLIAGLVSSIPLVVFAGTVLAGMMERLPVLANAGAALLAAIGAHMIVTDPSLVASPASVVPGGSAEAAAAVAVLVVGRWRGRRSMRPTAASNAPANGQHSKRV